MTLTRCSAALSVALTCLVAQAVMAQPSGEKTLVVARAAAPPAIDGRIDASEWATATVVEDFHQVEPIEFASPSERTRVYVMIDADNIYIAARMWDSEPAQVAARSLRQGEALNDDDVFGVALDTFNVIAQGGMNANVGIIDLSEYSEQHSLFVERLLFASVYACSSGACSSKGCTGGDLLLVAAVWVEVHATGYQRVLPCCGGRT